MYKGVYALRNPLLFVLRPKLVIGGKKYKYAFRVCHKIYRLKKIRGSGNLIYLVLKVDIVDIIIVVKWLDQGYISGFFDTPIGHFRFDGKKVRR